MKELPNGHKKANLPMVIVQIRHEDYKCSIKPIDLVNKVAEYR